MTSKVVYLGDLRTECTHIQSGTKIITDAPLDNQGKGESFSPTDLLATSLASCMMTIIGIYCKNHGINFDSCTAEIEKIMGVNPRKVEKIIVHIDFTGNNWDSSTLEKVIIAGKTCPVAKTIEDSVQIEFNF
ncbi:MAG: OsmC family peroxiredoxin [Crocinitomicaceae bacterium]|nr:OsmC family peroxiredoxin [Crocinitomicaceae bacterium]